MSISSANLDLPPIASSDEEEGNPKFGELDLVDQSGEGLTPIFDIVRPEQSLSRRRRGRSSADISDPEESVPIPKFGAWDDSDPQSADRFTHIFNKIREEKSAYRRNPEESVPIPKFGAWEDSDPQSADILNQLREELSALRRNPEESVPIPKFGAWDDSDPQSADRFTHIFNKVREEKSAYRRNPEESVPIPKFGAWEDSVPQSADGFTHIFNKIREEKSTYRRSAYISVPDVESSNDSKIPKFGESGGSTDQSSMGYTDTFNILPQAELPNKSAHTKSNSIHGFFKSAGKTLRSRFRKKPQHILRETLPEKDNLADGKAITIEMNAVSVESSRSSSDSIPYSLPLGSQSPSSSLQRPLTMAPQLFPKEILQNEEMSSESHSNATQNSTVFLSGGSNHLKNNTLKTLLKYINSSSIGMIGIYGKSGVGKTALIEALKDLPGIKDMYDCVIAVTVPETCSMTDLQAEIARESSLGEVDDYGIKHLVESFHLKFLLIIDDVNEHIDLEIAGIPKPTIENSCKIVFTSRSEQVCTTMGADLMIRLEDLLSWEIFCEYVGSTIELHIQPIARQVVEMCNHSTRAIILMARALSNESDVDVWNTALERLSSQSLPQEENFEHLMVSVLKFICERLDDDRTRRCFRRCVILSEKQAITRESLIDLWFVDGLIKSSTEGNKILEDLIHYGLVESIAGGVFLKLLTIDHHILLNSIIPYKESRLFLMCGASGLTEPPELDEWKSYEVICLNHNELAKLPANPVCPVLSALFLQGNVKLRKIPPSFFEYMPALKVLNLSRTRIKSLPESLFELPNLKRLFVNKCDLLMVLPSEVGKLEHLEILDLEGTEIMDLPKEVEKLTHLVCLEVSFLDDMNGREGEQSKELIPQGILSVLANLEELNITVSPGDKRWDACVRSIVVEVCSLARLSSLMFYFPEVEHLDYYLRNSTFQTHPLSNFRFIVGESAKRIISRLPRDIEFELQRWDRSLQYVDGVGVCGDIKEVLKCANAFHLDRHTDVKDLLQFEIANMEQLKCCVLGECNELQVIVGNRTNVQIHSSILERLEFLYIYYMKSLTSIWEGPVPQKSLSRLKSLTLKTCPSLTTLLTPGLLDHLCDLEELTVEDCPILRSVVKHDDYNGSMASYYCSKLKRISLRYLPDLVSIFSGLHVGPKLEWIDVYNCPSLIFLSVEEVSSKDLKRIKGERSWWEAVEWRSECPEYLEDIFVAVDTFYD